MAERRMFAKSIIENDAFSEMPASSRLLYYDLGMQGDDDGFVDSPRRIMRATGASDDDLKLLRAKQYIIYFESGVVVIRHWKVHNYLRSDRYKPTLHQNEKALLFEDVGGVYSLLDSGIPTVYQLTTDCLPTGSIGEQREIEGSVIEDNREEGNTAASASATVPYSEIMKLYNSICVSLPKITRLSDDRKKAIKARFNQYTLDDFAQLFAIAENTAFLKGRNERNWTASFDWLIADKNMAKVLDGNYTDRNAKREPLVYGGVHGGDKDGDSL